MSTTEIGPETVAHYARLANLAFDDVETARLAKELAAILAYADTIGQLELSDVAPTFNVSDRNQPLRPDQVEGGLEQDHALANAPESEFGHFLVPKMIQVKRK